MPHLVLVGLMGSGKTTIGRRLARELGRAFFDTDEMVEARTGRKVREIFEHDGETSFRRLESAVLAEALDTEEPCVVAAAGGVVLDEANRIRLRSGHRVVWLRPSLDVLDRRLARRGSSTGNHRPLLDSDPVGVLRDMDRSRSTLYDEVATEVVDVEEQSVDEVVALILSENGARS